MAIFDWASISIYSCALLDAIILFDRLVAHELFVKQSLPFFITFIGVMDEVILEAINFTMNALHAMFEFVSKAEVRRISVFGHVINSFLHSVNDAGLTVQLFIILLKR